MNPIDKQLVQKISQNNDRSIQNLETVASATECTGLIPTPPITPGEAESYVDLYTIPKPENRRHNGLQSEPKHRQT